MIINILNKFEFCSMKDRDENNPEELINKANNHCNKFPLLLNYINSINPVNTSQEDLARLIMINRLPRWNNSVINHKEDIIPLIDFIRNHELEIEFRRDVSERDLERYNQNNVKKKIYFDPVKLYHQMKQEYMKHIIVPTAEELK